MKKYVFLLVAVLVLAGCRSHKPGVESDGPTGNNGMGGFAANSYLEQVKANESTESYLSARVKVTATMDDKSLATSGTLRMKKDDVIQISLVDPILGVAEVGRMEFTKNRVLIIDRINKQYIDASYSEANFLQRANVDFNTLQSLFWNEIFQPGRSTLQPSDFSFSGTNGSIPTTTGPVYIDYKDRLLQYRFSTQQPKGTLTRTAITSSSDQSAWFSFDYSNFSSFEGKSFPYQMVMSFVMGRKAASLSFSLSSVRNASDWQTRTKTPSKYTKVDPEKLFHSMIQ